MSAASAPGDMALAPSDPFPREEFSGLIRRLPSYARLSWALARHPHLSRARRAAVLAGAAYVISPIDLIPGIIPVVGQLDDLLIALGVIKLALAGLKPEFRAEVLTAANLSESDIGDDARTAGNIVGWMGRSTVRIGFRITRDAAEIGRDVLGAGLRRIRR